MSSEIVIPTSGRPSLRAVLDAVGPEGLLVVDDRRDRSAPLPVSGVRVLTGPARGPAAGAT